VESDAAAADIATRLTMLGLEVEGLEDRAAALAPFTVGYVTEARRHPNADRLSLCLVETGKGIAQVAREMAEIVEAARAGTATPEQLTGSTITVSNYGAFGSEAGTPIINHPEAAILGVGRIGKRALVVDGRVEARTAVTLALSFDHRVMDGADADRAMTALRELLESPFRLGSLPR